jgi:hypothetical protein
MNKTITNLCLIFSLILATILCFSFTFGATKAVKLIEWGWDTPTTIYVKNHIREMEQLPFDGLVLDLKRDENKRALENRFAWNVWTLTPTNLEDFQDSYKALKETEFRRFTDNFLRFNVTPGDVDWFDQEFSKVVANAAVAAKIVKSCKMKGILLDVEQYQGKIFDYTSRPQKTKFSLADYQKQVEQCGRQFIQGINEVCPDMTIFLTYGYNLADRPLAHTGYELLPSFLDGILEAASSNTVVVDGWEFSYGSRTEEQFKKGRDKIYKDIKARTALGGAARRHYRCGFGLWVDNTGLWFEDGLWGKNRIVWHEDKVDKNYFTPKQFEDSLRFAIKHSDGYVWIYSEKANWWNGKMPKGYIDALIEAQAQ